MYDQLTDKPTAAPAIAPTDGERLLRFVGGQDEDAFAEVIDAHAAMVWGVCWQVLRQREDVEDAFQATFFILARKAHTIQANDSAAAWLYQVAFRTALRLKEQRGRRATEPLDGEALDSEPLDSETTRDDDQFAALAVREQTSVLLEELHALPERYQRPLVLHYLEAKSRSAVAEELGTTTAAVKGRLARARSMLRSRLARRGVALSAAMGATTAALSASAATLPAALPAKMAGLSAAFRWKSPLPNGGRAAANLANKGLTAMTIATTLKPAAAVLTFALAAALLTSVQAKEEADKALTAQQPTAALDLLAAADEAAATEDEAESDITIAPSRDADERPSTTPQPQLEPTDARDSIDPDPQPTTNPYQSAPQLAETSPAQRKNPQPTMALPQIASSGVYQAPAGGKKQWELERDYWKLKGEALEAKAGIQVANVKRLFKQNNVSRDMVELAEAEANLLRAESLLCQSKSVELVGKLEMLERSEKAKQEGRTPFPAFPAPQPQPIRSSYSRGEYGGGETYGGGEYGGRGGSGHEYARGYGRSGGGFGEYGGEYGGRGGEYGSRTQPAEQPAKLAPGDLIQLEIYLDANNNEFGGGMGRAGEASLLNRVYTIEPMGTIALGARYGRVKVAGMDLIEAEAAIRKKLSETLENVQVQATKPSPLPAPSAHR